MEKEEQKLKMAPQKVELVAQEKVAPLIQGYDKVRVIMPSLALLSQIVGLRFMFHARTWTRLVGIRVGLRWRTAVEGPQGAEARPLGTTCLLDGRTLIGSTIWGSGLTHISFALLKR